MSDASVRAFDQSLDSDYELLNQGIAMAARQMLETGGTAGTALSTAWRQLGIDPATIPVGVKKHPHMFLPGAVARARETGQPVRCGSVIPVR